MNRIGVLTSGGDAPGMNAAIRAVLRTGLHYGLDVVRIRNGFEGLIAGEMDLLDVGFAANIIHRGGTVLRTSRCEEFFDASGRKKAAAALESHGIEGLIVIGGDGSFRGTEALNREHGSPVVGIPATIDNDVSGTDQTIGFDTALNTAMQEIDRIRDTAESYARVHFVEVMGRHVGFLALDVGLAGGAEEIIIPEEERAPSVIADRLKRSAERGKLASIIVVAEGERAGGAFGLAERVNAIYECDYRVTVLGFVQRAATPLHATGSWPPAWARRRSRRSSVVKPVAWSVSNGPRSVACRYPKPGNDQRARPKRY
jgi:6-phosphofructokinase 1